VRDTELLIDQATGAIVESIDSTLTAQPERFVFGDNLGISVTPLERNTGFDAADKPWRLIDMSNKTIKVAIGTKERNPTNGTFNINTIDDIAYNVSGEELETALNTDATITSEGGCKVSALSKGGWKVTFLTLGAKTALTSTTNDLTPTATLSIDTINAGGATEFASFFIRTETNAASSGTLLDDIDALAYTVATVQAPDAVTNQPAIYSFELVGLPVGGTFSIGLDSAFTRQIGYDADSEEINEALIQLTQLASAESVSVEGSAKSFAVSISPDVASFTASADVTNLQGLNGKQGELNINTVEMIELLNGNSTAQGTFEIVLDDSAGTSKTIHQSSVEIAQDVISSNAPAPSPLIEYALKSDLDALQAEVDAITGNYVDLTTAQTIAGEKTFTDASTFNSGVSISGSTTTFQGNFNGNNSGNFCLISGAFNNTNSGNFCSITGQDNKSNTGDYCSISGANNDNNSGIYCSISGSNNDNNSGEYCSISGQFASNNNLSNARVHGGGANARIIDLAGKAETSDATPTDIKLNGQDIVIPQGAAWSFTATITVSDSSNRSNAKKIVRSGLVCNNAGTLSVSSIDTVGTDQTLGSVTASVSITTDNPTESLKITCTGDTASLQWAARIDITQAG